MPRMSHLIRRNGTYYFKADLPDDLAGRVLPRAAPEALRSLESDRKPGHFKTAVWKSLRTHEEREAKRKAGLEIAVHEALFEAARHWLSGGEQSAFSAKKAHAIAEEHRRLILTLDELRRREGLGIGQAFKIGPAKDQRSLGMSEADLEVYARWVEETERDAKRGIARFRVSERLSAMAEKWLLHSGEDPARLSQEERQALEADLAAAERRAMEDIRARLDGDDVSTPPQPSEDLESSNAWTFTKAFRAWADGGGGKGAKKPASNTIVETEAALKRFIELHGDMDVMRISKAHTREFRDAFMKVPKGLPRSLKALPLAALLKRDLSDYPLRSASTINKTMVLLGAVLARAERDGHFDKVEWRNPFDVVYKIDPLAEESFDPFSKTELNMLFASAVFAQRARPIRGRGETAKWAPLVALLQGARRSEVLQLYTRDVVEDADTGIWVVRFDRDAGKSIKNLTSVRRVPVHPLLIQLGFLDFHKSRLNEAGPDESLWPGFEGRDKLSSRVNKWGEWFGTYLDANVVDDPRKAFHSFRGTFKRFGREAGVDETVLNHLVGHSNNSVGARYGRQRNADGGRDSGYPLERLAEEIARIDFAGVDWKRIR